MVLTGTVDVKGVNLGELADSWGVRQVVSDNWLYPQAAVKDWKIFDNQLARAGIALIQAADLRGMKLHQLVEARLELDAEKRERENHSQR